MPTIAQLTAVHPAYRAHAPHWGLLSRLVDGGLSVSMEDKKRLLRHPDNRPEALKRKRAEVAHFSALLGGLSTKLQSQITRSPGVYVPNRPDGSPTDDPFWGEFMNDAGDGESFHALLSQGMLQALTTGCAFFQVDTPPSPGARNREEQRAMGGDRPFVIFRPRTALPDWQSDRNGFSFAKIHTQEYIRDGWQSSPVPSHRYQIYQRTADGRITSQQWRILPKDPKPDTFTPASDDRIEEIGTEEEIFHLPGDYRFPLIPMRIPPALEVGTQLYEVYSQYFTQLAAINYASLVSLWRQLIFTGADDPAVINEAVGGGTGDGFYWALPEGIEAKWLETDTQGLEFALKYADSLKAAMYDQISQIAASAAASYGAIARSGESKKEDRRNMDILLETYGSSIRSTAKQVLDCAAIARGEALDWVVQGFSKYDSDGLLDDLAEFTAASPVVNSPTFDREGRKAIAAAGVRALGLSPELMSAISEEIEGQGLE